MAFIPSSRPCDHTEDGGLAFPLRSQGRPGRSQILAYAPGARCVALPEQAFSCVCVTSVPQSKHRVRHGGPQASRRRHKVCAFGGTVRRSGRSRCAAFRSSPACPFIRVYRVELVRNDGRLERGKLIDDLNTMIMEEVERQQRRD